MASIKSIVTGAVFGRLTVTSDAPPFISSAGFRVAASLCCCCCGNTVVVRNCHLRSGHTQSCGCLHKEATSLAKTTHGHSRHRRTSREFNSWMGVLDRTTNPNSPVWLYYGGRGIKVCDRWLKFENFYADMGDRPSPEHSIDRVDNDGPYSPENCRWATRTEQANNKTNNTRFVFYGLTKTLSEWSRITQVPTLTISKRLKRNWPPNLAFWAPNGSKLYDLLAKYPHYAVMEKTDEE